MYKRNVQLSVYVENIFQHCTGQLCYLKCYHPEVFSGRQGLKCRAPENSKQTKALNYKTNQPRTSSVPVCTIQFFKL